jgi:hypothetical protein
MQQQGNVRVKTYYGATPDESARQFQADAAEAAVSGFSPTSQAWNGPSLTVTYLYHQELPSRQPVPAAWNLAGIAVVVAGILGAVGAALPWATVTTGFGSISRSGLDGGDGIITIIVSIGVGLLGLGMVQRRPRAAVWLLGVVLSLVLIVVAFWDGGNVNGISNQGASLLLVSVGIGLYLTGIAGLIGVVGSVAARGGTVGQQTTSYSVSGTSSPPRSYRPAVAPMTKADRIVELERQRESHVIDEAEYRKRLATYNAPPPEPPSRAPHWGD